MKQSLRIYLFGGLIVLLTALFAPALAAQAEKPFAENKFVLQISDMDPDKQTLVLNVNFNYRLECFLDEELKVVTSPLRRGNKSFVSVVPAAEA